MKDDAMDYCSLMALIAAKFLSAFQVVIECYLRFVRAHI